MIQFFARQELEWRYRFQHCSSRESVSLLALFVRSFAEEMRTISAQYSERVVQSQDDGGVSDPFQPILQEIQDGIDMLVLRSKHVALLYQALAPEQNAKTAAVTVSHVTSTT